MRRVNISFVRFSCFIVKAIPNARVIASRCIESVCSGSMTLSVF